MEFDKIEKSISVDGMISLSKDNKSKQVICNHTILKGQVIVIKDGKASLAKPRENINIWIAETYGVKGSQIQAVKGLVRVINENYNKPDKDMHGMGIQVGIMGRVRISCMNSFGSIVDQDIGTFDINMF